MSQIRSPFPPLADNHSQSFNGPARSQSGQGHHGGRSTSIPLRYGTRQSRNASGGPSDSIFSGFTFWLGKIKLPTVVDVGLPLPINQRRKPANRSKDLLEHGLFLEYNHRCKGPEVWSERNLRKIKIDGYKFYISGVFFFEKDQ